MRLVIGGGRRFPAGVVALLLAAGVCRAAESAGHLEFSRFAEKYCLECHKDVFDSYIHSAHKFSSFNNPFYLFSIRQTREVGMKRDGSVRISRWCAGCHDPVPFFSGAFDDPKFDMVNHPTSQAGITCVTCHSITHLEGADKGPIGNGNYTIEEPVHYPFAQAPDRKSTRLNSSHRT